MKFMSKKRANLTAFMGLFLLCCQCHVVMAGAVFVGSRFNYQGELLDGGSPANGIYDVQATLWTNAEGGNALANVVLIDVLIEEGLLNVELDYGDTFFSGEERFLEIGIRPSNDNANFVTLSPRSRINATPFAIQSEFVENVEHPWEFVTGGVLRSTSDASVGEGSGSLSTAKFTINSAANQDALRVRVSGSTKFLVQADGGVTAGSNQLAPENGLFVGGEATQPINQHGFIKAATVIDCGAGINVNSTKFFNNINGNDFSSASNGASGGCTITVPFDIDDIFYTVSAHALGGVEVFQTVVASCSENSNTSLQCQIHDIQANNTNLINGTLQILFY